LSEFQRVRILHVVTSSVSAVFMRGQLSYLRDKGFDVFLASAPGPDLKRVCDEEQVQEITIAITREISPLRDVIALFRLWRLMLNIKPTITNVSTPKAGLLGGIAAFAARVPVRVYTLRGLRLETARGWKRSVLMMMERIACGSAHHVRCVGASVRDRAIQLKLVGSKKSYVLGRGSSNGVDFELFRKSGKRIEEARALRLQFKIPDSAPVIGFVGRFTRDKGIAELYRAFQQVKEPFPDTRLLLVGDFEEGDPVDAAVRQGLETEPGVIFAGMVKDTPRYYAAMDVLALPTYREGFPNVPLEAQAASVPVVTTELARKHNLLVVEDCAQAHGATYKDKPVGSMGHVAAFSFCQDKIMTTGGEGGMLVTNNEAIWERAWAFKDHGKSYDAVYRREHAPGFRWLHEQFGTNWRLTEMQSALGRVQLRKLPEWVKIRQRNAEVLTQEFGRLEALRLTPTPADVGHSYYKYYAFVRPERLKQGWSRDRIMAEINERGVPCFSGSCSEIYLEKAFTADMQPSRRLPVAKELGETSLMWLVHPTLKEDDVRWMAKVVGRGNGEGQPVNELRESAHHLVG
jgi:hypothetical protein